MYSHYVPTLPGFPRAQLMVKVVCQAGQTLSPNPDGCSRVMMLGGLLPLPPALSRSCFWGKAAPTAPREGKQPLSRGWRTPCSWRWQNRDLVPSSLSVQLQSRMDFPAAVVRAAGDCLPAGARQCPLRALSCTRANPAPCLTGGTAPSPPCNRRAVAVWGR